MKTRGAVIAVMAGLGVTVVLLVGLSHLAKAMTQAAARVVASPSGEVGGLGWAPIWLVGLGVVVGATAIAARFHYLIAAVPGVFVLLVYLPFVFSILAWNWYSGWFGHTVLEGLGSTPFVVSGVLYFAAVDAMLQVHQTARRATTRAEQPTGD